MALTKTKKLVEHDRVHVVVGVILSAAAIAMKDYIHAQEVPFIISGAAVAEPLMMEKPSPYVFRTTFSASQVPTPLAKFAYDKLKARTATVIAGDTVGTIELVMGFARAFEEAGGKVVQELYAPIGTTDFGPFIGRIRRDVDSEAQVSGGAASHGLAGAARAYALRPLSKRHYGCDHHQDRQGWRPDCAGSRRDHSRRGAVPGDGPRRVSEKTQTGRAQGDVW